VKFTVEISDERVEAIVREIFNNFPEASNHSALQCAGWKYKEFNFVFLDTEDNNKEYIVRLPDALRGFKMFMDLKSKNKLRGVDWEWNDSDQSFNYDALACDCIAQLACFGEVIYG